MDDKPLKANEAAEFLNITPATLRNWNSTKNPPPKHKTSTGSVFYYKSELNDWIKGNDTAKN